MIKLSNDCDYYNDERDDSSAPDYCDECYRWDVCIKAYMKNLIPIPLKELHRFKNSEVWIQYRNNYTSGKLVTINDIQIGTKTIWTNKFIIYDYGINWNAYPMYHDRPISFEEGDVNNA